jgi:energy-coupling factor transport system ATP-binding protein
MLVGLLKVQSGDLMLFGKAANRWKVQDLANQIALVFQNPEHQFLTDTVGDEIGYSLLAQGVVDQQEIHTSSLHMMRLLGLESSSAMHPFALSAGLKRRLGVATMLVGNPRVLLVDEPTYGQDKKMTSTLMELMSDIRSRGIAVVMITHDMRLVQEYADRVIVMGHGNILYDGGMSGLFERGEILRDANLRPTILHSLIGAIRSKGVAVQGEIRRTADLTEALKAKQQGAQHGR